MHVLTGLHIDTIKTLKQRYCRHLSHLVPNNSTFPTHQLFGILMHVTACRCRLQVPKQPGFYLKLLHGTSIVPILKEKMNVLDNQIFITSEKQQE
jgi:hypothetical protein